MAKKSPPVAIGKAIMARAKKIRNEHPHTLWKNAVKKAGEDYRAGRLHVKPKKK